MPVNLKAVAMRVALLVAMTASLTCVQATRASAAPFELRSCQRDVTNPSAGSSGWRGENGSYFAPIALENDCPDGLGFNFANPTIIGNSNSWAYAYSGWLRFSDVSATFESEGSFEGYRVTVRGCDDCAPVAELDPASDDWKTWTQRFEMGQSKSFVVDVECVVFNCPPGGRIRLHSIIAHAEDQTKPALSVTGLFGGWSKRAKVKPNIYVSDNAQTGLASVSGKVAGTTFWEPTTCVNYPADNDAGYFTFPFGCPASHSFNSLLDLRSLTDGRYELVVNATDGAGNVATPFRQMLKLDDTPPDPPYDIEFRDVSPSGWAGLRNVRPSWQIHELNETETSSPIRDTWYDFKPRSSGITDPPAFRHYVPYSNGLMFGEIEIPADGLWDLFVWHTDAAENVGGKQKVTLGRDLDAPPPPVFEEQGWFSRSALVAGAAQPIRLDRPEWLESGVCGVATVLTQSPESIVATSADIAGVPASVPIPPGTPDGTNWLHARSVSCAGLASEKSKVRVRVDSVRPRIGVAGLPSNGWTSDLSNATADGRDDESGVARIELTRVGGPPMSVDGDSMQLELDEGRHELNVQSVDNAGNESGWIPVTVSYDPTPPSATFEPRSSADPTLLTGWVRDATSGVASATVQLRPSGAADDSWNTLATEMETLDQPSTIRRFGARLPDEQLPAGVYDVRVVVEDAAGNRGVVYDLLGTGVNFTVSLPARSRPSIEASLAKVTTRCKPLVRNGCRKPERCSASSKRCRIVETVQRSESRKSRTVPYASRVAFVGSVVDSGGRPLVDQRVAIYETVQSGSRVLVREAITDSAGRFTHRVPAGPNRRFSASVPATAKQLPATAHADLWVSAAATLKAQVRARPDGKHLRLYGRLRGSVAGRSAKDVTIEITQWTNGSWRPWFEVVATDANGNFTTTIPFVLTRTRGAPRVLRTRAFIRAKGTVWPYENGQSNVVRIRRPK